MTTTSLNIYDDKLIDCLEEFSEAIHVQNLMYNSWSLEEIFNNYEELNKALDRAIRICAYCGVPITNHFKPIFFSSDKGHFVKKGWRLSKLGFSLLIINGDPDVPIVGQLQLRLIRKFLT